MEETINFGYIPEQYSNLENSRIVIIPVAYDGTSTWIRGASKGPEVIIDASANLELYDIETDSQIIQRFTTIWKKTSFRLSLEESTLSASAPSRPSLPNTMSLLYCSWMLMPTCARSTRVRNTIMLV